MKPVLPLLMILSLAACHQGKDFSKVVPGMHSDVVVELIGTPERRQPMGQSEWWLYNDSARHLIVIGNDTVIQCTTQAKAMKVMEQNMKTIDSIQKK